MVRKQAALLTLLLSARHLPPSDTFLLVPATSTWNIYPISTKVRMQKGEGMVTAPPPQFRFCPKP